MYGRCKVFKDMYLVLNRVLGPEECTSLKQWTHELNDDFKVTTKETVECKFEYLVDEFQTSLKRFRKHIFSIRTQYLYTDSCEKV